MTQQPSLIDWLRKIQGEWDLSLEKLAVLIHLPEADLKKYLDMDAVQISVLPTVPAGLEGGVALVSIYKKLVENHSQTEDQLKWLFTKHKDFGEFKPIDIMAQSEENLFWVSYYLSSS